MACMRALLLAVAVAGCGGAPVCDEGASKCGARIEVCEAGDWTMVARYECGSGPVRWTYHGMTGVCELALPPCASPGVNQ